MTKSQAKQTACAIAASVLQTADDAWETLDPWPEADQSRIQAAWDDLVTELHRRGENAPPRPKAPPTDDYAPFVDSYGHEPPA